MNYELPVIAALLGVFTMPVVAQIEAPLPPSPPLQVQCAEFIVPYTAEELARLEKAQPNVQWKGSERKMFDSCITTTKRQRAWLESTWYRFSTRTRYSCLAYAASLGQNKDSLLLLCLTGSIEEEPNPPITKAEACRREGVWCLPGDIHIGSDYAE
jgi:hypothetical protein